MATAKKCDRCGKYYDYYNTCNGEGPNTLRLYQKDEYGNCETIDTFDLCPDCNKIVCDLLFHKELIVTEPVVTAFVKSCEEDG